MSRPTEAEYARIEEAHKLLDQIESLRAENEELMALGQEAASDCARKDKELAALRTENEEKAQEIERLTFMLDSTKNVAIQRGRKLDSVTAERDEAVADIEQMAASLPVCMVCQFCKHGEDSPECAECDDFYNFEWRGAQGEA